MGRGYWTLLYHTLNVYMQRVTWKANNRCTSLYSCLVMLVYYNVFGNGRQTISIPSAWLIIWSILIKPIHLPKFSSCFLEFKRCLPVLQDSCIHTFLYTHTHSLTHTHTHTLAHTHTHTHTHTYTHIHIHTLTHTYMYTYTLAHIHTELARGDSFGSFSAKRVNDLSSNSRQQSLETINSAAEFETEHLPLRQVRGGQN